MAKKKSTQILKYALVFEEAEEAGYTVVPSLPDCISEGDTFETAKKNVKEAISAYRESLAKDGDQIPLEDKNYFVEQIKSPLSKLSFSR